MGTVTSRTSTVCSTKEYHPVVKSQLLNIFSLAPAEDAISYEVRVFHSNFNDDRTPYQGPPTDAVDAAWEGLYNGKFKPASQIINNTSLIPATTEVGINRITPAEAAKLPNATVRIPGDEQHYIVGLDVMHQLHCLNHLRKTLYPERYQIFEKLTAEELGVAMDHTGLALTSSFINELKLM